jgi:pilus assembly protein CpaE
MGATAETYAGAVETEEHVPPVPRISIQAFCEGSELGRTIEEAARDRRMSKCRVKVQMGGVSAALEAYRDAPTPNLIVLETLANRATLLAQLGTLADYCDAGTQLIVIGHENDIALYRELTSRGVSDYIVAPFSALEFIRQISLIYNGPKAKTLGRMIAVVGAKGGVGSSTLAHNIGWSISRQFETQTVIADLDLAFGTVALNFNQDPMQGIADAIYSPDRLDANFVDRLLSRCGGELSILSAPVNLDRSYDLHEDALDPLSEILASTVPCSILDVPHCWAGWTKRVLVSADEVVVVACPDLANLRNAKAMIETLRQSRPNDRPPRIVLNMVGAPRRPEISVAEFAKVIEIETSGVIPFDPKLFGVAANNGQMLDEVDASAGVVETIAEMARALTGRPPAARKAKRNLLPSFFDRFVGGNGS